MHDITGLVDVKISEAGLVSDVSLFMRFREARNLTSHAYEEGKAELVFALIPSFLETAHNVLTELRKRNPT